ncbi:FAD-dependent oxidoreductase [Thermaerobacter litoralis]
MKPVPVPVAPATAANRPGPSPAATPGANGSAVPRPPVVVAGGGIAGTAVAFALQDLFPVVLVDDGEFPGLGETRTAVGVLKALLGHPRLDEAARITWAFALAQHEHPRSPVRLSFAALDDKPERAAFLDHLLLLDAMLLLARRRGLRLLTHTRVVEPVLRGGRVVGVRTERAGSGPEVLPAAALVLAPGPRTDSLALEGLPDGFAGRFVPVKDVVIPFRLPEAAAVAPAVYTRRSLIWQFVLGLEPRTLLAAARLEGDWAPPSFEELVALVDDLVTRFDLPGEAELDRTRTLIDLRGPEGLPFAGPVAPLGGAEGLFVLAGLGLEGLSLSLGLARQVAAAVAAYAGLPVPAGS